MTGWNLPPGCNESDIPGNRPEDVLWDSIIENISQEDCESCVHGGGPATYLSEWTGHEFPVYTCCMHNEQGDDEVPNDCIVALQRFMDKQNEPWGDEGKYTDV